MSTRYDSTPEGGDWLAIADRPPMVWENAANAESQIAGGTDYLSNKLDQLQNMENQRLNDEYGGSGNFFQRLLEQGGGETIPLVEGPGEAG